MPGRWRGPSVAVQFYHIHQVRLFWLSQTAPQFAKPLTSLFRKAGEERIPECDPQRIEEGLKQSARAVCDAMKNGIETDQPMKGKHVSYDHPVLFLQHMLWHEGYHFGQTLYFCGKGGSCYSTT